MWILRRKMRNFKISHARRVFHSIFGGGGGKGITNRSGPENSNDVGMRGEEPEKEPGPQS